MNSLGDMIKVPFTIQFSTYVDELEYNNRSKTMGPDAWSELAKQALIDTVGKDIEKMLDRANTGWQTYYVKCDEL